MKIVWDKSHEIGVKMIDRQHQHFFELINKIMELSTAKRLRRGDLEAVTFQLAGYAMWHFSVEESFFKRSGYPGKKRHYDAHQHYREKVLGFIKRLNNPRTNIDRLAAEISNFSVKWLTRHTLSEDKLYAIWLNRQREIARTKK